VGGYALVGAAAIAACITWTTCVSIIVLELSRQLEFMPNTLIAQISSQTLFNNKNRCLIYPFFSESIFTRSH